MNVHSSFIGGSSKQYVTHMSNRQAENFMYPYSGQISVNARHITAPMNIKRGTQQTVTYSQFYK